MTERTDGGIQHVAGHVFPLGYLMNAPEDNAVCKDCGIPYKKKYSVDCVVHGLKESLHKALCDEQEVTSENHRLRRRVKRLLEYVHATPPHMVNCAGDDDCTCGLCELITKVEQDV